MPNTARTTEQTFTGMRRLSALRGRFAGLIATALAIPIAILTIAVVIQLSDRRDALQKELVALQYRSLLHEAALNITAMRALDSALQVEASQTAVGQKDAQAVARAGLEDHYARQLAILNTTLELTQSIPLSERGMDLWKTWLADVALLNQPAPDAATLTRALTHLLQFTEYYAIDAGFGIWLNAVDRSLINYSAELVRLEARTGSILSGIFDPTNATTDPLPELIDRLRRAVIYQEAEATIYSSVLPEYTSATEDDPWSAVNKLLDRFQTRPASLDGEAMFSMYEYASEQLAAVSEKRRFVDDHVASRVTNEIDLTRYQTVGLLALAVGLILLLFWVTAQRKRLDRREQRLLTRLQRTRRRYHLAVDSAQVGVFERPDMNSDQAYWSPKLYELMSYSRYEPAQPLMTLVHPDYRDEVQVSRDKILQSQESSQLSAPLLCGDGEYRWFAMNAVAHKNEARETAGLSGTVISIHHLKEAETLAQSERKLKSSVRKLKTINSDLEQFSRMASHDLQEPLRMITSFTELLEEDYGTQLDERGLEYIKFASDGAKRMREMLQDLMLYAKEGRREATPQTVDVNELIQDVLHDLALQLRESKVTVDVQKNIPPITADSVGLTCILQNLISNAIKYRGSESPTVKVRFASSAEYWSLSVRDNGIGFDPEQADTIFKPFTRLHGKDDYEGNGIGLGLCQRIASNWRANLDVTSAPGKGSTFTLTAPMLDRHYSSKSVLSDVA